LNREIAFVLGNGITRLQINCKDLLNYGYVYGCNRIYQEFAPSVLVSTDPGMAEEIQDTGYSSSNIHYVREQYKKQGSGSHIIPNDYHGMSSGPAALGIACDNFCNYLYIIGMDLKGVNNKINNIYAGTKHYREKNVEPTVFDNWVNQIEFIMNKYKNKRFIHVNPLDNFTPDVWRNYDNYEMMNLTEFKLLINNMHNRILNT
tara:strand:- start:699 stop:1307 length:609 start_codon:yes stop_codon:yes gene_type:complete